MNHSLSRNNFLLRELNEKASRKIDHLFYHILFWSRSKSKQIATAEKWTGCAAADTHCIHCIYLMRNLIEVCLPCGFNFTCLCTIFRRFHFQSRPLWQCMPSHAMESENKRARSTTTATEVEEANKKKCVFHEQLKQIERLCNISSFSSNSFEWLFSCFCNTFVESTVRSWRDIFDSIQSCAQNRTRLMCDECVVRKKQNRISMKCSGRPCCAYN